VNIPTLWLTAFLPLMAVRVLAANTGTGDIAAPAAAAHPLPSGAEVASPPAGAMIIAADTRTAVRQLIGDTVLNGQAYEYDRHLADLIGPRLTGSANFQQAVNWAEQEFKALGLSSVHTEEWTIPSTWEPEVPASGHIVSPVEHTLHIVSLGWSPSTPPGGITGKIVYVKELTVAKLEDQKSELKGAIALFDRASFGDKFTINGILEALEYLRSLGPIAIINTGIANGAESLTSLGFHGMIAPEPEAQVGLEDSLLIKRLLEHGPVTIQFSAINRIRAVVQIPNVIAELPGKDPSSGIVLVGAHLDSWQPGTGAQDNGTGLASVLETARAIKALNRAPRRTIRFVLFSGEEQGLLGSGAYVRQHQGELDRIDAVLVTDSGSEAAKGWMLMGREDEKGAVQALKPLLSGLGADGISSEAKFAFQSDHAPFEFLGVPELVLWTGMEKYDGLHHKASDTFDSVINKDLTQGAAVIAVTAYAIADSTQPFASHLSAPDVRTMAEKSDNLPGYDYFKKTGTLP
jgi:carboxypeptidase Q